MDRYSKDEADLKAEYERLDSQLTQAKTVVDQLTRALLQIQGKLDYIAYRRVEEAKINKGEAKDG